MLLATPFTLPIALGSAIFVVEVQPWFGRRIFQPLVELLMGIPSVVYGPIGLTVVNAAMRAIFGEAAGTGAGILSGGIVLAVIILPTVTTLSIDGLSAVPKSTARVPTPLAALAGRRSGTWSSRARFPRS